VNQPLDDVNLIVRQTGIDIVQLHGTESPDYCRLIEKPVIKVIHVNDDSDPAELEKTIQSYSESAAYYLFDTKSYNKWGGTGKTFNWKLLSNLSDEKPLFLSGGLNSGNIKEACKITRPFAVDLSSGVEKAPGVKDYDKLDRFFDEMREIWEVQEEG
jgi:phosphoribosylanthranilate isomerase